MKRTTKILCVLLAAVILTSVLNISTVATKYGTISLGEVIHTSSRESYGKLALDFIPQESGYYAFYSIGESDTCGYIFDSNSQMICENDDYMDLNFYAVCKMTAGEKYCLRSELYANDGYEEYSVSVKKVSPAEEIFIYHGGETSGYVGNYLYLECIAEPVGTFVGDMQWESDNEDIVAVSYCEGYYCQLYLAGVGKANISVTTENGLSDSVEITVLDIPEITLDEPQFVSLGSDGGSRYFNFTPESSGSYAIYTDGAYFPGVTIYDSYYNEVTENNTVNESGDVVVTAQLTGGETYTVEVYVYEETPDFWLCVTECSAPEGVKIASYDYGEGEVKGYRAMQIDLYTVFTPAIALSESCTWTSSNEDVAMVFGYGQYGNNCELLFVDEGTAEITVTTESGLTDTIIVECLHMEELKLNEEVQVINAEEGVVYSFSADHNGVYAFVSEGGANAIGLITDSMWNIVDISLGLEADFSVQTKMYPNDICYMATVGTGTYTVKVVECQRAESVSLSCGTDYYGYVGEYIAVEPMFNGVHPIIEDCEYIVSNENVLESYVYDGGGCELFFANAGTAEVTVTSESGLTATCTFHIKDIEAEELLLDEEKTVTLGEYTNNYFTFVPEEDGVYSFVSIGDLDTNASHIDRELYEYNYDDDSGVGSNFCIQLDMVAGKEYMFRTSCFVPYEDGDTYTVKIIKSPVASEMLIVEEGVVNADVGSVIQFVPEFRPAGALREDVYFRVSDRSVIEVFYEDESGCIVTVMGEGVATVEAYTDSGLYAEVTIIAGNAGLKGDVDGDGDVNALDSNLIKRFITGKTDDIVEYNADVNGDGDINSLDSYMIKMIITGKDVQ